MFNVIEQPKASFDQNNPDKRDPPDLGTVILLFSFNDALSLSSTY